MPETTPGREVLRRAREGDDRAFAEVVSRCGGLVLNLAWRMVRDRQEAEDLSQEVFLRLHRVFMRYDLDRPFMPWLRRVTTNLLINLTSSKKNRMRRQTASLDRMREERGEHPPAPDDAVRDATRTERAEILNRAILELSPDHRAILALRYYRGLSYEEVAETLELPMGTVKNRLYRAREAIARLLKREP